jgi:hypothetical protein
MEAQRRGDFEPSRRSVELSDQDGEITGAFQTEKGLKKVRGFHHQSELVLSYTSQDPKAPGAGVWVFEYTGDTSSTYVGYTYDYDCGEHMMTLCPAVLAKDADYTIKNYIVLLTQFGHY